MDTLSLESNLHKLSHSNKFHMFCKIHYNYNLGIINYLDNQVNNSQDILISIHFQININILKLDYKKNNS